jgi:small subunit ribosomal protein S6
MNQYETMVIVDAMISDDAINKEIEAISATITADGGEISRLDDWGKRKMAYPIKKKSHGYYSVFYYTANAEVPNLLEKNFRINENVLRWLTLKDHPVSEPINTDGILDEDFSDDSSNDQVED